MTKKTALFLAAMVVSFVVAYPHLEATESLPTEDITTQINNVSSAYFAQNGGIEPLRELLNGIDCAPSRPDLNEKIHKNTDHWRVQAQVLYVYARWLEHFCETESTHELFYESAAHAVWTSALALKHQGYGLHIPSLLPIDAIYRHGRSLLEGLVEVRNEPMQSGAHASTWRRSDTLQVAIRHYLFAAWYAHPDAQFDLGELHSGNLYSESPILHQYRDEDQARSWYLASAAMGHLKAREVLKERWGLSMEEDPRQWAFPIGTTFYIANNRLVTAAHVVEECGGAHRTRVYESSVGFVPVKVELDDHSDLAVLELDQSAQDHQHAAPLGCTVRSGDAVFALGFPNTEENVNYRSVHPHVTSGIVSNERGYYGRDTTFLFSGPIAAGQSGGPIVGENFRVTGVVSREVQNYREVSGNPNVSWQNYTPSLSEAVSAKRIHALLKTSCDEGGGGSSLDDIKKSVVPLYCYYDAEKTYEVKTSYGPMNIVPIIENQKRWMAITKELSEMFQIAE